MSKYIQALMALGAALLFALSQYYKAGRETARKSVEKIKRRGAEKQKEVLEDANEAVNNAESHGKRELKEELDKAKSGDTSYFER